MSTAMSRHGDDRDVLTIADAAEYLRISERTCWQLARAGEIPCRRIGAQYRFFRSQLENWMQSRDSDTASGGSQGGTHQ
ncbi:MAG: helix-turn-helix domain-containing protein [Pirellulaceae bacterium]